jgi:hypothetical protein
MDGFKRSGMNQRVVCGRIEACAMKVYSFINGRTWRIFYYQ